MIQGINICKSFDGIPVLNNTSFHIEKGSVYGLVGPNGSGKSTLLRHIAGIFRSDSGEILIDGENVFENMEQKSKIAFIPDDIFYFRQASLNDMKNYYKGIYPDFNEELYNKLIKCFCELHPKKLLRNMSKGMQKQAAFVLAISIQPEILILDEPMDGLDPLVRRQIWSLLFEEVEQKNLTVIISSHNLRELEDACDHVGIMYKGQIITEMALDDLQNSVTKLQIAFSDEAPDLHKTFDILHMSVTGKIYTLIINEDAQIVREKAASLNPLLADIVHSTLEEVFIYKLGGVNNEIADILL